MRLHAVYLLFGYRIMVFSGMEVLWCNAVFFSLLPRSGRDHRSRTLALDPPGGNGPTEGRRSELTLLPSRSGSSSASTRTRCPRLFRELCSGATRQWQPRVAVGERCGCLHSRQYRLRLPIPSTKDGLDPTASPFRRTEICHHFCSGQRSVVLLIGSTGTSDPLPFAQGDA